MAEIRVCENCGYHNNLSLLECEKCGFDLSMIQPIDEKLIAPQESATSLPAQSSLWSLIAIDDLSLKFDIDEKLKIGRVDSPLGDYLNKSDFISREHAQLVVVDGQLCLTDASTNGTFINGKRVAKLEPVLLCDGNEVIFADVKFKVVRN
jgi:hypothetical protein